MTAGSTAAGLITSISLLYDYFSTKNFKHAGSGLSPKQNALVIVIIFFLFYLSIGALIFNLLLGINYLDALYFVVVTVTTCGFGTLYPRTLGSKIFVMFYAPIGIVCIALLFTSARSTILEEFQQNYRERTAKFRQKYRERNETKKEHMNLKRKLTQMTRTGKPIPGLSQLVASTSKTRSKAEGCKAVLVNGGWRTILNPNDTFVHPNSGRSTASDDRLEKGLSPEQERAGDHPSREQSDSTARSEAREQAESDPQIRDGERDDPVEVGIQEEEDTLDKEVAQMEAALEDQRQALREDWQAYRRSIRISERNKFWAKLSVSFGLFIVFWMIGSAVFMATEGWSFFGAFYFCFVFFSTIGYGAEYAATSQGGRAFFTIWALAGIGIMSVLFSVVGDTLGSNLKTTLTRASTRRASKGAARVRAKRKRKAKRQQQKDAGKSDERHSVKQQSLHTSSRSRRRPANPHQSETPIEDLPLELARGASKFHEVASHYMETHQEDLANLVTAVPDIKSILPPRVGGDARKLNPDSVPLNKLGKEERKKIKDRGCRINEIKKSIEGQDDKLVAVSEQVFALIEFEGETKPRDRQIPPCHWGAHPVFLQFPRAEQLHTLLKNATAIRNVITSQKEELDSLRGLDTEKRKSDH